MRQKLGIDHNKCYTTTCALERPLNKYQALYSGGLVYDPLVEIAIIYTKYIICMAKITKFLFIKSLML